MAQFDYPTNAQWLAHRYDEAGDGFRFIPLTRDQHRAATFITDEYLTGTGSYEFVSRGELAQTAIETAPLHFIFHSAYCCSTLLARAFDIEGVSMGLKEPVVLNDMVGWRRRGAEQRPFVETLGNSLDLLARPFGDDRAVIVKPSNVVNHLAFTMMSLRPEARAVLLYAPPEKFLRSIARKGLWGRRWARELFVGLLRDRVVVGGFSGEELLELTDLQIAALGWLSQHALFAALVERCSERVRTLDSETLLGRSGECVAAASNLYGLNLSDSQVEAIVSGPAFTKSSKDGSDYNRDSREQDQRDAAEVHGDEIEKVAIWLAGVAQAQGIAMTPKAPLVPAAAKTK